MTERVLTCFNLSSGFPLACLRSLFALVSSSSLFSGRSRITLVMDFSPHELAKIAIWFDQTQSVVEVQRRFRTHFNDQNRVPSRYVITACHGRLLETGSVLPGKRGPSTPPRPRRTLSTETRVLEAFRQNPEKSLRQGANELGLSSTTIFRILHEKKMKPYKIQILQALNEEDVDRRLEFAEHMLARMAEDETYLDRIIFSDEAIFKLHGGVNKQNIRYWDDTNPRFFTEEPLHAPQVVVWCGLWSGGIIGPFFFDSTVNSDGYLDMLQSFLLPRIREHVLFNRIVFMQDGAPPHFGRNVRSWLDDTFSGRWIGRRGSTEWPPRSPDLTPCDFFLWGYLKSLVYAKKPATLPELKEAIKTSIAGIDSIIIDRSLVEFKVRMERVIAEEGRHIE